MIPTSVYTPLDDRHFTFNVPIPILDDPPRFSAQASAAIRLLRELNQRISGTPVRPCAQILVFNHDLLIED